MVTILSDEKVGNWLGISKWYLGELRKKGLPYYSITREFELYSKEAIVEWINKYGLTRVSVVDSNPPIIASYPPNS